MSQHICQIDMPIDGIRKSNLCGTGGCALSPQSDLKFPEHSRLIDRQIYNPCKASGIFQPYKAISEPGPTELGLAWCNAVSGLFLPPAGKM